LLPLQLIIRKEQLDLPDEFLLPCENALILCSKASFDVPKQDVRLSGLLH
jgi:hypothetical protein